jgi:hypothetical protein
MCETCRAHDRVIRQNRRLREEGKLAPEGARDGQPVDNAAVGGPVEGSDGDEDYSDSSDDPEAPEPTGVGPLGQGPSGKPHVAFMTLLKPSDFAAAV